MALEKVTEFEYPVIDMDCHIVEPPTVFTEYMDSKSLERCKEVLGTSGALGRMAHGEYVKTRGDVYRMHMESDEAWQVTLNEPDYIFPGVNDGAVRLQCMDQEGIDKGLVRNTFGAGICSVPDVEVVDSICRAYNNWVRDFCNADPDRLFPEALLPCADIDLAVKEFDRVVDMGFKGTVVPGSTGAPAPLSHDRWDPLWERLQAAGWPLCAHATFNPKLDSGSMWLVQNGKLEDQQSRGVWWSMLVNLSFMLDNIVTLGEITLGGMCDKFPNLNVYFIEAGHSWIGETLYRLDKMFACPPDDFPGFEGYEHRGKTRPSEIFERQVFVPFEGGDQHYMADMSFKSLAKNLIWASDIPHWDADGPWEGVGAMRALKVPVDVQTAVMGGNAAKMLNIPHDKKVGTSPSSKAAA